MSAIKFQVGEPKKLTLSFDEPKTGVYEQTGKNWYRYGIKSNINSDEDCFFASERLHDMIQTLGAKEGDEITIEKHQGDGFEFFKVNGLSFDEMNSGGAFERIQKAKPTGSSELEMLREENKRLKAEIESLNGPKTLSEDEIPF
jgi:hypothetical protein